MTQSVHPRPAPPSRCPRARRGLRAGFTIAEVIMAMFVMALGISTSIIGMQAGFRQIDLARGTTIAAQIIQSELERLRMMSWTSLSALASAYPTQTFDGATYFSSNPEIAGRYSVTRAIASNSTNPTEVKDITVTVTWRTYDGRPHSRSFTAIYAKNGLYDYYYTVAHP